MQISEEVDCCSCLLGLLHRDHLPLESACARRQGHQQCSQRTVKSVGSSLPTGKASTVPRSTDRSSATPERNNPPWSSVKSASVDISGRELPFLATSNVSFKNSSTGANRAASQLGPHSRIRRIKIPTMTMKSSLPVFSSASTTLVTFALLAFVVAAELRVSDAQWWYISQVPVHRSDDGHPRIYCDNIPGLDKKQRKVCMKYPHVMLSLREGVKTGITECQRQFHNNRWNCSVFPRDPSVFGKAMLQRGNKEAAFVHAVTSAGVTYAVSRSCSRGDLATCHCDKRTYPVRGIEELQLVYSPDFKWGGCTDNVRYGSIFTRKFIDSKEKLMRDARAQMNLHNNRAGRKAVRRHLSLECKCHGVSGSCAVRTCWQRLENFRGIGDFLKRKFDTATEVTLSPDGSGLIANDWTKPNGAETPPTKGDLVYFEESPDYCEANGDGFLGTTGRECKKDSDGPDSCDILCCGRGYDTTTVRYTERCNCKFIWCCNVECDSCSALKEVYTCKSHRRATSLTSSGSSRWRRKRPPGRIGDSSGIAGAG